MQKPNRSFAKKVFAAGLAISTALWASAGLFVFVAQAVEAHPAGTLVLSGGTVWHISDDGAGRHGIDSLVRFYSHRYDFADVVPANSADSALPDLGLLPGGHGVLFNDGGTVYQVSGGMKHGFTSAANFTGNGFSFANVMAGDLSLVPAGAVIDNTTAAHLEGTFVVSGGTVWMVTATGRKGVPSPGVLFSYGADFDDAVAANSADLALAAEANATFRTGTLVNDSGTIWAVTASAKRGFPTASCFTDFGFSFSMPVSGSTAGLTAGASFCPTTTPPTTSAGVLSVSLASDTPAATLAVENAARVGFTKVNFTASGGDVIIDSLVVERTGVAQNAAFSDIILLDVSGGKSVALSDQIGNEKSLGSDNKATFGDDITVKNGTTKSILVAANMGATLNAGQVAFLSLVAVNLSGSATVSGTVPIVGNGMTFEGAVAIATVTVANGAQNPAASTQNVGTKDYVVSSIKVTAGGQEDIEIHRIRFYQNGTAADEDVQNLELLQSGNVIATFAQPKAKVADFVFTAPLLIEKGQNKDFDLRADITGGSSRTISLDIDKRIDVVAKGKTFGYFRLPTYDNTVSPFYNANNTTIDVGTITFSKGVLSSLSVADGGKNQPMGVFKVTVQGEPVQVTQFVVGFTWTGTGNMGDITNVKVKDKNGAVVAGPVDPDTTVAARDTGTTTDTIIFPTGTNDYTIYADLNTDPAAGDTIRADLPSPNNQTTAKGTITNQTITAGPTSDLTLDTVTVRAGAVSISTGTSPAAQSVIIGASQFTFANYTLSAVNSGEDVRVTQMAITHKTQANSIQSNIANLTMYDGSTALAPILQPANTAVSSATSTFTFTNPIVVAKGTSKTLSVKGDIVAGTGGTHWHQFGCNSSSCATATGADTASSITPTVTNSDGQRMTLATTGTFTLAEAASSPQTGALIVGGSSKVTVAELLLTASQEEIDLQRILFQTVNAVNDGDLTDEFTMVYLFDGATQVASLVPTSTTAITFSDLEGKFRIKIAGSKLTVKVDAAATSNQSGDANTGDSGDGVSFDVAQDAYTGKGVLSGTSLGGGSISGAFTGQQFTVYKSIPTVTKLALASGTLVNSSGVPLFKFKLAADAKGDIGLYSVSFAISTTTATVTAFELFENPGETSQINLTNNATRSVGGPTSTLDYAKTVLIASSDGKGGQYGIYLDFDTGTDGIANGGEFRTIAAGASKTFELRGTVANSTTGSSVSVVMLGDNAFTSTYPNCAGDATVGNTCTLGINGQEQGKFVWSDLHYGNSSSTATQTTEWFNGFRVPGLTATTAAEVLSK